MPSIYFFFLSFDNCVVNPQWPQFIPCKHALKFILYQHDVLLMYTCITLCIGTYFLAVKSGKKRPTQDTGLGDRGLLKALNDTKLILHLKVIWYCSEPSDVPYSQNQFLDRDIFCHFLQLTGSCSQKEISKHINARKKKKNVCINISGWQLLLRHDKNAISYF